MWSAPLKQGTPLGGEAWGRENQLGRVTGMRSVSVNISKRISHLKTCRHQDRIDSLNKNISFKSYIAVQGTINCSTWRWGQKKLFLASEACSTHTRGWGLSNRGMAGVSHKSPVWLPLSVNRCCRFHCTLPAWPGPGRWIPQAAFLKLHQMPQNEMFGKQLLVKLSREADIIQGRQREEGTDSNFQRPYPMTAKWNFACPRITVTTELALQTLSREPRNPASGRASLS